MSFLKQFFDIKFWKFLLVGVLHTLDDSPADAVVPDETRLLWGRDWYGEEILFGELGAYSKSETVEIKGTNYSHTFTLESSADGDVNIYGATPADFH